MDWRVHVNGIRGQSTVTRIIAGMIREAGIVTIAKSTGTFAAVINQRGVDEPIDRRGPATILEQIEVCRRYVRPDVQALVIECMALKPEYQEVSERMIVRSNIGVLTNVREDHQDVMGETLPEIARSLLSTCPRDGILVTAEHNPEILAVIREVCAAKRQRADRRRSRHRHRRGHQPLRLHRLQGERLHRAWRSPTSWASLAMWRWTGW